MGVSAYMLAMDYFGQNKNSMQNNSVNIPLGSSTKDIANILKENKIINYPHVFIAASRLFSNDGLYKHGTHNLNSSMTYADIMDKLKENALTNETFRFTIPEGFELKQVVSLLDQKGLIDSGDFMDLIQNEGFDFEFLRGLPKRDNRLEGYLFPDTYEVFKTSSEKDIIIKMLNRFNEIFEEEYYTRAKELGLTIDEVITLASIIERETKHDNERETVSSVFHNRLKSNNFPYLQSCATVQYVLGERKTVLSVADTKINSPYNTYMIKGLPIGPIASPGKKSIHAALYPAQTQYLFFVANSDGSHIFSRTLSEHNLAIKKAK